MCSIMELYIQACTFTPVSVKSPCGKNEVLCSLGSQWGFSNKLSV